MSRKIYSVTTSTPLKPNKVVEMANGNELESLNGNSHNNIPKVFIDGEIPTTKNDVLAEMTYVSNNEQFHAYIKIKCQGSSSMAYSKKNFTIKLYSDEERETKLKKGFKGWDAKNKFVLKANFIDHSHARNIVSARLWNEVVGTRTDYETLTEEFKSSPNNGAIDGFPIKVYANGTYQGIYTWNIGKDDWLWGMDEDNPNHALMCAETNTGENFAETPCNFRKLWSGIDEQNWSVEVGTNSDTLKNSLNALISCVKDTDDETFVATIEEYLDLQSAIDYYIHQYIICGLDGLGKNMLLGTYDMKKWQLGAYDMDSTFGLWWEGTMFVATNYRCPEDYQEKHNLLFERIVALYPERYVERYVDLRKRVYSISNMVTHFENFMDVIGKDLYAEDLEVYTGIPCGSTNNIKQIRDYIRDRLTYVDEQILGTEEETYLYKLEEPMVFDGTSTYLDTGVQLFNEPKDFTIYIDMVAEAQNTSVDNVLLVDGKHENISSTSNLFVYSSNGDFPIIKASNKQVTWEDIETGEWQHKWEKLDKIALVYKNGLFAYGLYHRNNDVGKVWNLTPIDGEVLQTNTNTLLVGAKQGFWSGNYIDFWKGTINDLVIFDRALTKEEITSIIFE